MAKRRAGGRGGGPDRPEVLLATYRAVIAAAGEPARLVIGGKSMGGRIASMVADGEGVAGLVCLGYPFHPPGKPEQLRTAHLVAMTTPALVVQGTRDPFGTAEDVAGYGLSSAITLRWLADGDHDWKPRKSSGRTHEQNLTDGIAAIAAFVAAL
jgi:predicted alpha/beta-hydrolase family hydrolase